MTAQTLPIFVGGALCALLLLGVWLVSIAAKHKKPEYGSNDRNAILRSAAFCLLSMRRHHQLTRKDIAAKSGIALRNLTALENGQYVPTFDLLCKYADALDAQIHIQIRRG
jgi:DNA-binding XRE family transcriptional regulator